MANEKEFTISREFNAPLALVWKVNTEPEHLAKWWGPVGLKMVTCKVDLRPGGIFHYGMEGPNGQVMWGKFVYREITPMTRLVYVVSFSDEKAGITRHPMAANWPLELLCTVTLSEKNGKTTIFMSGRPINANEDETKMYFDSFDSMNKGFAGTYDQLENYLQTLKPGV